MKWSATGTSGVNTITKDLETSYIKLHNYHSNNMQNNNDYNNDKLEVSLNLNCICTVKDKPYSDIKKN